MAYLLEFYSLDWQELGTALAGGDRALLERVDRENGANFFRGPQDQENHLIWRKILAAIIGGRRGQALAAQGPQPADEPEELSDIAALAMVGIIRTLGVGIGELEHSSRSGAFFREDFFEQAVPAVFRSPVALTQLLSRPLFGVVHETYPSWGGLTRAEVKQIIDNLHGRELPPLEDSDLEGWMYDLYECLSDAHARGTDIVTLYT